MDSDTVVSIEDQTDANDTNEVLDARPAVPQNPAPDRPTHVDAKGAMTLAAMTMKAQYDARHEPKFFEVGDRVSLGLNRGYTVPGLKDRNHCVAGNLGTSVGMDVFTDLTPPSFMDFTLAKQNCPGVMAMWRR